MGLYKVIFLGMAVAGPEEEVRLIKGLQKKFNLTPEKAESLLQRVPIVVRKGISKEEMERYVKAFEEIGGRVRVEEEPITEPPEISQPSEPTKKPYMGPMITCPQCGFEQPETDECIKCGVILSKYREYQEMARSYEGRVREISSGDKYSPWESGDGFVSAFLKTTRDVLFSPTQFYKKVAPGEGYWSPLIYGIIAGIIGAGVSLLWQRLLFFQLIPPRFQAFIPYSLHVSFIVIGMPFMMAFSILVGSGVIHLCLMIVGGNKKGFQATFRTISYSFSTVLFDIVPFIGNIIGRIYMMILFIIGLREGHGISTGRAAFAVFLPVIVAIGFGIIAILLFTSIFLGSMRFFGGVGV